jgi:hypothetical protein
LNDTIEDNRNSINYFYSDINLGINHDLQIQQLTDLTGEDIAERHRYEKSVVLLNAICNGIEPPIHNTDA